MSALRNNWGGIKHLILNNPSIVYWDLMIFLESVNSPQKKSEAEGKSEDEILVCVWYSGHEGCNLGIGGVPFKAKDHNISVERL